MLEKYKEEQPVLYNLLSNSIKNNKLSHAYIFNTNDNPDSLDIIYSFIKELLCDGNKDCCKSSVCSRIENGNFLDFKVIEPDGLQIKKEQMRELQEEFNKVSLELNRKIYVIKDCEKMNLQAANSILKFLEEPIDNITAILITNNINKVLKTIVSRCQIININKKNNYIFEKSLENLAMLLTNSSSEREKFLSDDGIQKIFDNIIKFIEFYENNKSDTIVYTKELWHDNFKDRQDNLFAIDFLINFYYDALKYKINGQVCIFVNERDLINKVCSNELDALFFKLEKLIEIKKLMSNNLNINLLVDYMILNLERR